jgi:DNA polymerase-3 subunit epsilon
MLILGLITWYVVSSRKNISQSEIAKSSSIRLGDSSKITISGPNPEKTVDFMFYKFVQNEPPFTLEHWYNESKKQGIRFKETYKNAIDEKLATGKFRNPIDFEISYGNKFDFIAIDFETANNERISACKIGLVFVHEGLIVNEDYYYIKPPKHIKFAYTHTKIHGITTRDVENAENFKDIWENWLKTYLNNNLIVLHNSSMDASILRQLFEFYNITNFNLTYVDTLEIAKKNEYPTKLIDLSIYFGHKIINHHDPVEDATACAIIAQNFIKQGIQISDYKKFINDSQVFPEKPQRNKKEIDIEVLKNKSTNSEIVSHNLNIDDTKNYFCNKKVVVTGTFIASRQDIVELLNFKGADVNTSISKKTNIIIVGDNPGPSKLVKLNELIEQGYNIEIMDENIFWKKIN